MGNRNQFKVRSIPYIPPPEKAVIIKPKRGIFYAVGDRLKMTKDGFLVPYKRRPRKHFFVHFGYVRSVLENGDLVVVIQDTRGGYPSHL